MKLATYEGANGAPTVGVVDTGRGEILDLAQAGATFRSLLHLIESGDEGMKQARAAAARWPKAASRALAGTRLLAPLPVPQSIRDCLVFEQHLVNAMKAWQKLANRPIAEIPKVWYERPTWYKGNRFSVVGHEDLVRRAGLFALRDRIDAAEVTMAEFERALAETRASVTPEMEREYEQIEAHLKQDARGAGGIGFIAPGMLTPRGEKD